MKKSKFYIYTILFAILYSCSSGEKSKSDSKENTTLSEKDYIVIIKVPPEWKHYINPTFNGTIHNINFSNGDEVKKNQKIAWLSCIEILDIQQEYLSARYELEYLKEDYKRQGELTVENVTSVKKMQKAQSEYLAKSGICEAIKKKLLMSGINPEFIYKNGPVSGITLYAPVDGFIFFNDISNGSFLTIDADKIYIQTKDSVIAFLKSSELNAFSANQRFNIINNNSTIAEAVLLSNIPIFNNQEFVYEVELINLKIEIAEGMVFRATKKNKE